MSTYEEPIRSWTGNVNGPVLAFAGIGLGVCHVGYNMKNTIDFVPVDMCVNGLLATTWDSVANRYEYKSSINTIQNNTKKLKNKQL